MRTRAYFDDFWGQEWPDVSVLEMHFRAPPGKLAPIQVRGDEGNLTVEGLDDTEHLDWRDGRVDAAMLFWAHSEHGCLLHFRKTGRIPVLGFYSRGNLARRHERIRTRHGTPLSVGLFIPVEDAWSAISEFMKTRGALPKSIEWVSASDLPADTFPDS